ncbi:MAG: hypothetical protein HY275_06095, partial [Gemmatimonadetes bacterium]|nr:hypothetical protein [Gemmatimonadota bacterium]
MSDAPDLTLDAPTPELGWFLAHVATDQAALDALPLALAIYDSALRLRFANVRWRRFANSGSVGPEVAFPRARVDLLALAPPVRLSGQARSVLVEAADGDSGV